MSKAKIIIIACLAIAIVAIGALSFSQAFMSSPTVVTDDKNVIMDDRGENGVDHTRTNGQYSSSTQYIGQDDLAEPGDDAEEDSYKGMTPEEEEAYRSRPDAHESEDALILSNVNQALAAQRAVDFIRAFCSYNTETLRSGAYKSSWGSYVHVTSDMGTLLTQHMNERWIANTSTYPGVYHLVTAAVADSVYVSHATHNDTVAVSLTCIIDENQGEPGDMDWNIVNTVEAHYAVYMDADLNVVDVRRQDAKTIAGNIFGTISGSPIQ